MIFIDFSFVTNSAKPEGLCTDWHLKLVQVLIKVVQLFNRAPYNKAALYITESSFTHTPWKRSKALD
jgi:hypothetical protein